MSRATLCSVDRVVMLCLGLLGAGCGGEAGVVGLGQAPSPPPPPLFGVVRVARSGTGVGRVTSQPAGLACDTPGAARACEAVFPRGSSVVVTAQASAASTFTAWRGGPCDGSAEPVCTLEVSAPELVLGAEFGALEGRLELSTSGEGLGQITAVRPPLRCGDGAAECTATVPRGTVVTLEAVAAAGSLLGTWTGACAGAGRASTCEVSVGARTTVGFEFSLPVCPGALAAQCDGQCRDLLEDEDHCGGCGQVCRGVCSGGVCTPIALDWVDSAPTGLQFLRTEVTLEQFEACVRAGPCAGTFDAFAENRNNCGLGSRRPPTLPMNCVEWSGADRFCTWAGGRLPTEDEWYSEASDNGTRDYAWGAEPPSCERASMYSCDPWGHDAVCSHPSGNSVSGLCDMSGNVWEWTSTQQQDGSAAVVRGGTIVVDDEILLTSQRTWMSTSIRFWYYVGFRCVRPARP